MALRRKKKFRPGAPERLNMFHRKGGTWARDLDSGCLTAILEGALASSGMEAPIAWEQTGQLGTSTLMSQWPDFLEPPAAIYLRRQPRKPFGLELNVDIEGDLEVQEYGEDLRRYLMGEARLTEFQAAVPVAEPAQVLHEATPAAEPKPESKPARPIKAPRPVAKPSEDSQHPEPVTRRSGPTASPNAATEVSSTAFSAASAPDVVSDTAPVVAPPQSPQPVVSGAVVTEPTWPEDVVESPQSTPKVESPPPTPEVESPQATDEAEPAVEVFAPGERINKAKGRTWTQSSNDLFGLAGEIHPDDLEDHGLEIGVTDLPWLNPGDAIISPRRGPCRIKRVEDDARQVVAKDENKQMLVLSFDELLAEFQFDDGN